MEKWTYRKRVYTMEKSDYGFFRLNGEYECWNPFVYKYVTDEDQPEKMKKARREAEKIILKHIYEL